MTSLKELQESFQRGILAGDDTILSEIKDSPKEKRKVLFGVYRNAYVARLAEVLADDYEQVHAYLGDAGFAKLAKSYIAAHPSDRRSARDFGRHVPDFLKTDPGFAAHAEVAEIAALEKALADAFDGPEAEPLSLAALAEVAPELQACLYPPPHGAACHLHHQRRRHLVRLARRERAAAATPSAGAAGPSRLAPGRDGALQAARA
jgi:Putative DNA-binding domain